MFDFTSEFFGFMNQRPRYERELKEDTVNGYHIDTCAVDDRSWNYETAIQHEQFRGGEWIVVRGYDSKEEAEAGHDMWVKGAKAGFQKLYDVFEEKIYPKEKQEEKTVHFILNYACDRCMTSVKHEAYMKKKEFQEERFCPFCGEKLHLRDFEVRDRWF